MKTTKHSSICNCTTFSLMFRFTCMCGIHLFILACMYSHALQEQKSHRNKTKCKKYMLFLDQSLLFFSLVPIFLELV
jgi:hypothetical protein